MNNHVETLAHGAAVARSLAMCAPHMRTQSVRERFAELGERLAGLGGVEIVAGPIKDTMREVDQMLDGLIRSCKH